MKITKGQLLKEFENIYSIRKNQDNRRKQLIDSLKSFKDITPEKIVEIIDFFDNGYFADKEEAIEDLEEKINFYKTLKDPTILYRVIAVKNKKLINTKDLGQHFTPYKWAIDDDMLGSIGTDNWESDWKIYVMEVSVPLSEIDVWKTIIQNITFPNEHEINLKNDGKGAKFIKAIPYSKF